jgi:hypothetical protein
MPIPRALAAIHQISRLMLHRIVPGNDAGPAAGGSGRSVRDKRSSYCVIPAKCLGIKSWDVISQTRRQRGLQHPGRNKLQVTANVRLSHFRRSCVPLSCLSVAHYRLLRHLCGVICPSLPPIKDEC